MTPVVYTYKYHFYNTISASQYDYFSDVIFTTLRMITNHTSSNNCFCSFDEFLILFQR